ncbi:glycosyl hydrolase family 8 [Erysipelothrix inopinata]|uniref:glycosyl hydrolase family 8 n=1 Tax=Erysipelothrix inopinata TaxID=225084 RepID=UPI0039EE1C0C
MKYILKKLRVLLLIVALSVASIPIAHADEAKSDLIAEFTFKEESKHGVYRAQNGQYRSSATFEAKGGPYLEGVDSQGTLSYWGWSADEEVEQYWLMIVPTLGYKNLKLSSSQTSSGSGPKDFKIQASLDGTNWENIDDETLVMSKEKYTNESRLNQKELPSIFDNESLVYIRWKKHTAVSTSGGDIGGYGSNRIKEVKIEGLRINDSEISEPIRDLNVLPVNGAKKVSEDTKIEATFNYDIKLVSDNITMIGNKGHIPNITFEIENNKIKINHETLNFGEEYTVRINKESLEGTDNQKLVRDVIWSFETQVSPFIPKLMNMTFAKSPKTSMGFAWYTDSNTESIVQIVEASQVIDEKFPLDSYQVYKGISDRVETYLDENDRKTDNKHVFYSHKVDALDLKPGTQYRFRLGNGFEWSKIGSFTTDTEENSSFHFIVGADSQASSLENFKPWADTFRKARNHIDDPKFLILAGDLVDNGDLESHWQYMLSVAEDSLLNVPFVPVLGGHEVNDYDGDVTTENNNFYNHFNLERNVVEGTHDGSVYSYEYGDALFMVFNSQFEGGLAENGEYIAWEDSEFRAQVDWMRHTVAKSEKKWKFVTFHKSPYAAGDNSAQWEDERVQFYRKHLIPVFDELAIDMVFEAHDHMYMRSFQMLGNEVIPFESIEKDSDGNYINPKGTVYLMPNALGNKFYTKNNQHYLDENWDAVEIIGEDGKPIPYDDFFAAIDEQPFKKMFTDMGISENILTMTSYTAAVEDEGKANTVGDGLVEYDKYGIVRTDEAPNQISNLTYTANNDELELSWSKPDKGAPVRGYRVYESNDKMGTHWSQYIETDEDNIHLKIDKINPNIKYSFNVVPVGIRTNGQVSSIIINSQQEGNEPPTTPKNVIGKAISQYEVEISWESSISDTGIKYYKIYRDNVFIGISRSTSFRDSGLLQKTNYNYEVSAVNDEDIESQKSDKVIIMTLEGHIGRSFPQHTRYVSDSIRPNHISQEEMDQTVQRLFTEWKQKYLKVDPNNIDQKYVWYSDGNPDDYEDNEITVSEAHGYGMIILAMMANQYNHTQSDYDAMFRYFKAHPSEINSNLMAWQQGLVDGVIVDINGADSAIDGDMDIAYSLILAHEQWGSLGNINYLTEARKVIDAIMESEVDHERWTLNLADWANSDKYLGATRPSDWMMQHLKDFRIVSGDVRWDNVINNTYELSETIYKEYSTDTGLLPDFIVLDEGKHIPAPSEFLESENDGNYYYNSARTPWRLATDYLVTGEKRAYSQLETLNRWLRESTSDDVNEIKSGFTLNGEVVGDWQDLTFTAPFMVSAMMHADHQTWLNDLWDLNASADTQDEVYFGNNLRLLSMIVVSGNWFTPTVKDTLAPTAPVIDKVDIVSQSSVQIEWLKSEDNMGIKLYHVYRDGVEIASTENLYYLDSNLSSEHNYQYWVVAEDTAGNYSKASNTRIVTIKQNEVDQIDLNSLIQLIQESDLKHKDYYTELTWIPFETARKEAHDFIKNINEETTQEMVDLMYSNLKSAMNNLKVRDNGKVPETEYPNGKLPGTGMSTSGIYIIGIGFILLGFLFIKVKKS